MHTQPTITFLGHLKPMTGYGRIPEQLGRALEALGVPVRFGDYGHDRHSHRHNDWVKPRLVEGIPTGRVVHCAPPDCPFPRESDPLFFSMWESTGLPGQSRHLMNAARAVAVPSQWCAANFRKAGVTVPVHVVPLGYDPAVFQPSPVRMDGPTVFGMAARLSTGGCRKGINEGMKAFADAFPNGDEDVRLLVRIWADDLRELDEVPDHRISVDTTPLSPAGLAKWYRGLTCLFVPSKSEGFGLHTLEAMACGRPVIACRYSGTADFFSAVCGWELDYDLAPAEGVYEGAGQWAVPTRESMVAALRDAHEYRGDCEAAGQIAARVATAWTWAESARRLLDVLDEVYGATAA